MANIEYIFNNLDPSSFQRLINSILIYRFGENVRLTPLFGSDGGRDGETAIFNPYFEFQIRNNKPFLQKFHTPPQKGRYFFQVKHHRTIDTRLSDVRSSVISDFEKELKKNVLNRRGKERINFFFLVTNVPSSEKSLAEIDKRQKEFRDSHPYLYADIWWGERIAAFLDQMPQLWNSYPSLFAGSKVPFLADVSFPGNKGLPRATRLAIESQYQRDSIIKFRQIDLEKQLQKLFTGLDIGIQNLPADDIRDLLINIKENPSNHQYLSTPNYKISSEIEFAISDLIIINEQLSLFDDMHFMHNTVNALSLLLGESNSITRKIILEGGPGQGKSTLTQMVIQIYRQQLLNKNDMDSEGRWSPPRKSRLPLRIELRLFAEWLSKGNGDSIEAYLANIISHDAAGSLVTVDNIHDIVENSRVILVFDGLDEVGNDDLRNKVLTKIAECISRFEDNLGADLKVIITTRPPTVSNCKEYLPNFKRFPIVPMSPKRIKEYVKRWLDVQLQEDDDRKDLRESFEKRQNEPHVQAIIKNPMQLSVLLHFIRLKGAAFPDRRAELYREYFRTVIDRDVEKSSSLREQREIVESLHQFLGYKIHGLTEANQADGTLGRDQLMYLVENWLISRGSKSKTAEELFQLGEERLGLIVALRGEGEETRYGYEIQPIREYFAAAFINDDIEGNAHEVFQNMIRRPYWREVSLFLAGLRRPNEKADLIARAKNLDNDDKLGWRQDGRNLTLQLLQEGVFSQPPHIFAEALDYIFDILDPRIARFQNEPKALYMILPDLIIQDFSTKKRYNDRLQRLIYEYNNSDDEYILFRLYQVARKLLEPNKMKEIILSYPGNSPDLSTKIRMLWPLQWNIDLSAEMQSSSYWSEIPVEIWENRLWQVITKPNQIKLMYLPTIYHQALFEQFSFSDISMINASFLSEENFENNNLAILQLINYLKLFFAFAFPLDMNKLKENANMVLDENTPTNFIGLDTDLQTVVGDLLETSFPILKACYSEKQNIKVDLSDHLQVIHKYMLVPGLSSWLVSKWAIYIMNSPIINLVEDSKKEEAIKFLHADLEKLFADISFIKANNANKLQRFYLRHEATLPNPQYILLNTHELVKFTDLLANLIYEDKNLPFDWLYQVPLSNSDISHLIDQRNDGLEVLLRYIGGRSPISIRDDSRLHTSFIHRILKIARNTNDHQILRGALITLSSSKFLRLAGTKLCLKMIQVDSSAAKFTRKIFRKASDETQSEEREILNEIANEIMSSPNNYSFQANTIAANYLAESIQISLPALLSSEEELKIRIFK